MSDETEAALIGSGTLGGLAAFAGCFVQFYQSVGLSLVDPQIAGRTNWYVLAPIFVGLGTLGLFAPRRWRTVFGVLPLAAVGIAIGAIRAAVPGPGFYLVIVGGILLTSIWVAFLVTTPLVHSPEADS